MIKNAKVSLSAVKAFEQAVTAVRDYSEKFDKGILCFDGFLRFLAEKILLLRKTIETMRDTQNRLNIKKRELEVEAARFTARLSELEDMRSSFEDELAGISGSFEAKIVDLEEGIEDLEEKLRIIQQQIHRTNSVNDQLVSHIDVLNRAIYSLEEKQNICKQLKVELEEIKNMNFRQGKSANENMKKIEKIVEDYLKIKMTYENVNNASSFSGSINININSNVNKTVMQKQKIGTAFVPPEEIEKHQIQFDDNGRISKYDNKNFGGKYNSYESRLSKTLLDDNPIWGDYEGERGESKFIPSGRTVEGIIVKDILKEYDLDGIEYKNAEPDFEVCAEAVVKIKKMSENRENYNDSNGIPVLGNFSQADIACAKLWNLQGRGGRSDWNGRDVFEYRKANGLTWHEKCDMETMVLVRSEINLYFKHSGGCSECRMRDTWQGGGEFDE